MRAKRASKDADRGVSAIALRGSALGAGHLSVTGRSSAAIALLAIKCDERIFHKSRRQVVFDHVRERLENLEMVPPDAQDQIARAMLRLAGGDGEPEEIDGAHLPAVLEGLAQARQRQFASDAEVEAAFRRFDP